MWVAIFYLKKVMENQGNCSHREDTHSDLHTPNNEDLDTRQPTSLLQDAERNAHSHPFCDRYGNVPIPCTCLET